MSEIEIRKVVHEELGNIAPDVDPTSVDPAADIREAFDIDSMDFLNFVTALHQRLGIDIPETDYPKLVTIDGAVVYLGAHLQPAKS
jgi:acyl carrier protein